jgi:phosphoribosylamine--glycine ligase
VVGGGAREHALSWKLSQSPLAEKVYVAPGNPGLDIVSKLVPIGTEDVEALVNFARDENIGLVVIGPEGPLSVGLADRLAEAGIKVFGPKAAAARLESSKAFAKDFMARHHIPTAAYKKFTSAAEACEYLEAKPEGPVVVKASGLAQGKGVTVAKNRTEGLEAVRQMMEELRFGEAGREGVIEDFIAGEEVTVLAFCDGRAIVPMPPVQDHKAVGEGDVGPNTGGMGAYSPVAAYTPAVAALVEKAIIKPTLAGLAADGLDYRGCLYFGLMLPSADSAYQGPQVIEYNVRFGDPEAEVLMLLLKSDLAQIALACIEGRLAGQKIEWRDESAACVVLASGGYPGDYAKGKVITENIPLTSNHSMAFHGGTAVNEKGETVTAGGRVLTIAAKAITLEKALEKVYTRAEATFFEGRYFRRDIAHREISRLKR